ncbi:MAG: response regulator [bacterium]
MKKILLIEDESALQKTLGEYLRQEGYDIVSALDGEKGIELAKATSPDLILLDLILPKVNGFEVIKELKDDEKTQRIPIIILTNLEEMKDINQAIELGATTYLVKARYSLEEVAIKIKDIINK